MIGYGIFKELVRWRKQRFLSTEEWGKRKPLSIISACSVPWDTLKKLDWKTAVVQAGIIDWEFRNHGECHAKTKTFPATHQYLYFDDDYILDPTSPEIRWQTFADIKHRECRIYNISTNVEPLTGWQDDDIAAMFQYASDLIGTDYAEEALIAFLVKELFKKDDAVASDVIAMLLRKLGTGLVCSSTVNYIFEKFAKDNPGRLQTKRLHNSPFELRSPSFTDCHPELFQRVDQ